ncbi:hypothetical protein DMUE_1129 [Dictyocoela muelleri]|nr:hypothetical protein DMUE_1129 [Dictyocoela muelleri]
MIIKFTEFNINLEKDDFYAKYTDPDNSYFKNERLKTINVNNNWTIEIDKLISNFTANNIKLGKIPNCKSKLVLKRLKLLRKGHILFRIKFMIRSKKKSQIY